MCWVLNLPGFLSIWKKSAFLVTSEQNNGDDYSLKEAEAMIRLLHLSNGKTRVASKSMSS